MEIKNVDVALGRFPILSITFIVRGKDNDREKRR